MALKHRLFSAQEKRVMREQGIGEEVRKLRRLIRANDLQALEKYIDTTQP